MYVYSSPERCQTFFIPSYADAAGPRGCPEAAAGHCAAGTGLGRKRRCGLEQQMFSYIIRTKEHHIHSLCMYIMYIYIYMYIYNLYIICILMYFCVFVCINSFVVRLFVEAWANIVWGGHDPPGLGRGHGPTAGWQLSGNPWGKNLPCFDEENSLSMGNMF